MPAPLTLSPLALDTRAELERRDKSATADNVRLRYHIILLATHGYTAPQIATRLHIGVRTVKSHLARSYPKLGVTSKQQLVHRAAELGFTPIP